MRLMLAVDPAVGVGPKELAAVWAADGEASALGPASVESPSGEAFPLGLVEVVVIPLLVNLASTALYELVRRLVQRSRPAEVTDLELSEVTTAQGDRLVVVRLRRERS